MSLFSKYRLVWFFSVIFLGAGLLGPLLYFGLHPVVSIPFHRAMDRAFVV
jgi:hypothetical protein